MKIVNIIGGLGNQLFQYAFAIAMKAEFPDEEVKINTLCFRGYPLHNGFELDRIFNLKLPLATILDLYKTAYPWGNYRLWQIGHNILPLRKSMIWDTELKRDFDFKQIADRRYFDGYWQSEKFFKNHKTEIRKAFTFPPITGNENLKAIDFINQNKTAFIHIRRGDYVNHPLYKDICTLEYYKKSIDLLRSKYNYHNFIIFSNDIKWCKGNLAKFLKNCEVLYADWNIGNKSYCDIQLMSMCDAGIVANSSFSWWGAWLSDAKIILCPHKWINNSKLDVDIIPSYWIKI